MRQPQGYATISDPDRPLVEIDTFCCAHCQKLVHVPPGQRGEDIGGLCKVCMGMICADDRCHDGCDPFEKKIERMEARGRLLRDMGLG